MKLNEVFDSPVKWGPGPGHRGFATDYKHTNPTSLDDREKQVEPGKAWWQVDTYNFTVDDEPYVVTFMPVRGDDPSFAPAPKNIPRHLDLAALESTNAGFGITGTGNAYKVFSTALNIMVKHMQRTNIPILLGSETKYPSRVKLYSRMFDNMAAAKWTTDREKYMGDDFIPGRSGDEVMWLLMP